jgi:hypothetical protein
VDRGRRRKKMMGDGGGVYARDGKIGGHPSIHVNVIPADACGEAENEAGDIGGRREMMIR